MTLDRQVERARLHMEEHRAKHGDPMLDGRKDTFTGASPTHIEGCTFVYTDEGVPVYTYRETLPWWRRFIAWRGMKWLLDWIVHSLALIGAGVVSGMIVARWTGESVTYSSWEAIAAFAIVGVVSLCAALSERQDRRFIAWWRGQ